jgi:hypothetical protein
MQMNETAEAIELNTASWEQWIGAAQRDAARRALLAARPRRRGPAPRAATAARASLLWLLAASAAGFWLLH